MLPEFSAVRRDAFLRLVRALPKPLDAKFYGLLRRVLRHPEYACWTRFGAKMVCATDDYVDSRILCFGVWEMAVTAVLENALRPGATFIDVGANVGYDTLLAASKVGPSGKVIAIEPSPAILSRLQRNISQNAFQNIRVVKSAVGSEPGTISLYRGPSGNRGGTTTVADRGSELEAVVPVAPLHELVTEDEARQTIAIKVDVEGAEKAVMSSILDNLEKFPRLSTLIVEISGGYSVAHDFENRLKPAGFGAFTLPDENLGSYLGRDKRVEYCTPMTDDGRAMFDAVFVR